MQNQETVNQGLSQVESRQAISDPAIPGTGQLISTATAASPEGAVKEGSTSPPALSDYNGWSYPQYYETIQCADIDGDGQAELLARGTAGMSIWKFEDDTDQWNQLPAGPAWGDGYGWSPPEYYSTIRCADIDGDGRAELLGRGVGGIVVYKYDASLNVWNQLSDGPALSDAKGWNQPEYYSTIRYADIDGDGQAELLARGVGGIVVYKYDAHINVWNQLSDGPALSDANDWNQPEYYSTIQYADIDGDGQAELLARGIGGIVVYACDKISHVWKQLPAGPALSDANSWGYPQYYETIQCADIDGDGQAELLARGAAGMSIWKFEDDTDQWNQLPAGPAFSDGYGWSKPEYYSTIRCADIDGDGRAELLARGVGGIVVYKYIPASQSWNQLANGPALSDAFGWTAPMYYSTIQYASINGGKQAQLLARGRYGMDVYTNDEVRNSGWSVFPGLGPIPPITVENKATVSESLESMNDFLNEYAIYFQPYINDLYQQSQVSDTDPGQALANSILSIAFKAIAAVPVPGAGAVSGVLGGIFTYVSTNDPRGDLHQTFASVWLRFNQNLLDTKTQIAQYNTNLEDNWTKQLINQATGQVYVLADFVNTPFPKQATEDFNNILHNSLQGGRAALWKEVIPQRWNKVSVMNPLDLSFKTEQQCRDWIESYVNTNPNYYITYYKGDATWPAKGKVWRVNEWWLGYGFFPYGHHNAPDMLCDSLFTDDGLGNIVRPQSITTRKEVFTNWPLPIQNVVLQTYAGAAPAVRMALSAAQIQNTPLQLMNQDIAGAVLQQLSLDGADLSGVAAGKVQLAKSSLKGAVITNAALQEADLNYTKLQEANFQSTNLTGAYLQFADASNADFRKATLSHALALGLYAPQINLSEAVLRGAVLRGANLRGAILVNADLSGADLSATDLRDANLDGADLSKTNLRGALLTGASTNNTRLEGSNSFNATGLSTLVSNQQNQMVRCVAEGSDAAFDIVAFLKVSDTIADIMQSSLPENYGQMVENFQAAIGTFAMFDVPLSAPETFSRPGMPTLTFGTSGGQFYDQVTQQLQVLGINSSYIALFKQLGEPASYRPLGFRNSMIDNQMDIHVEFQGPMALSEVSTLLTQAGSGDMTQLVQTASDTLGAPSAMLTAIDFSPELPHSTQVYFVVNAGNAAAFSNLLSVLRIDWPNASVINQWISRTQVPYLVSVGMVDGSSSPEIGLYIPNDEDRYNEVETLLDATGQDRLQQTEELSANLPVTLAYIGIKRSPAGTIGVSASVSF